MRTVPLMLLLLVSGAARAQQPQTPAPATDPGRVDNPTELYKLRTSCFDLKKAADCAQEIFTGQPFHLAIGSIAPQNGFAVGLAYVGHKTTPNWRNTWNADAVASINGSWRAGVYVKLVDTHLRAPTVSFGTKGLNMLSIENEDPILPGPLGVERAAWVLKNVRAELLAGD